MLFLLRHRGPRIKEVFEIEEKGFHFGLGCCAYAARLHSARSSSENIIVHDGEIYNDEELRNKLNIFHTSGSYCDMILGLYERFSGRDTLTSLKKTLTLLDGSYTLALYKNGALYLARDVMGMRPLFYSRNPFPAFASERKALWGCGFVDIKSVAPGQIVELQKDSRHRFSLLRRPGVAKDYLKSVLSLERKLREATEKRTLDSAGTRILFSGGLDSTLLSCLSPDVLPITCGTEDSSDISFSRKAAGELNFVLKEILIDPQMVENALCDVMYACESRNPMDVGIALPIFFAAREASRNTHILLSGNGADELFGGYAKYIDSPHLMYDDIKNIAHDNLERDDMVAASQGISLRHPYLDLKVVRFALSLPFDFLFHGRRKRILADVAQRVGVPSFIYERKKTAMQYGSGVFPILKKKAQETISRREAKENGFRGPLEAYLARVWEEKVFPRFSPV
jgi:asparagine synthase (glutamine-hydrolysing)